MNMFLWKKNGVFYTITGIVIALAASLVLDGSNGLGLSEIFTGIALLLAVGAFLYLMNMQDVSEREVNRKVQAEYPLEKQPQVFEVYRRLKSRELDGLFLKILDDAKGDVGKVTSLANLAENVGWKAFIENKW
ncbi:MAG: hypothetical protein EDM79_08380 [Chloroflexi bacterium]|nr:MAG: hypothetical protein EDM79_08380 [Chloroflexota bacterium]